MIKRGLTYISSVLLITIYLLSYIGFAVHKCSCEGSTSISVLIGNPSCEHLHAHISLSNDHKCCEHSHECSHNHQDGCCTTEVLVLTSDQDNQNGTDVIVPAENIFYSYAVCENDSFQSDFQLTEDSFLSDIPPIIIQAASLSFFAQWRL